jgi:hypothetical protein
MSTVAITVPPGTDVARPHGRDASDRTPLAGVGAHGDTRWDGASRGGQMGRRA